ncbi:hypothetical protein Brms1b_001690 [Colletotrichum noveboracense]|nr:hypothetical protein COL940_001766 [Colletotrichum noveboracense]KAJ0323294.1 hypothetical protein Brms1b_001690 [Colletotrichum noveboracense]
MSSTDKSRQSSGGKSFFSRNRKDKRNTSDEGRYLAGGADNFDTASIHSRASRHHRDSSSVSIDQFPDSGLSAGPMTSIPYEAVPDSRSPVPVEYLPKPDQIALLRGGPSPHHLNKGGDFHQYPNFDPSSMAGGSNSSRTPQSNITMASTGRQTQYQQWGPGPARVSMASTINGSHNPRYDSQDRKSLIKTSTTQCFIAEFLFLAHVL